MYEIIQLFIFGFNMNFTQINVSYPKINMIKKLSFFFEIQDAILVSGVHLSKLETFHGFLTIPQSLCVSLQLSQLQSFSLSLSV